jgi:hypothetical protein
MIDHKSGHVKTNETQTITPKRILSTHDPFFKCLFKFPPYIQ